MIVTVLVGVRYGQREKIFDAVIDKVEVKPLGELSPREIEHDNPEIRRADELGLLVTGASDYHGDGKVDHELGCNVTAPAELGRLRVDDDLAQVELHGTVPASRVVQVSGK